MRDIGKNIRDLRVRKKLTQDALAEQLFVTRQTVSNYETGKSRPDIDMLMRIAEVLDTDIHTVLYGPQPRDRRPLIRLAIGGSLTLMLGILWRVSREGREMEYYNFDIGIMTWLYSISHPLFFTLLGWTVSQGIGTLTGSKPPRFPAEKWICLGFACIVLLWILLLMGHAVIAPLPRFLYVPCYWALVNSLRYPWLFLFPGIGIWLCGFPFRQ